MFLFPIGHHDRIYFVDKDSNSTANQLRFFSPSIGDKTSIANEDNLEDLDDYNNLKVNLDELKVTVSENIYHARQAPPIDPEMITKKLSLCSESIIKNALPV